jgi:hypothetical protein
MFAFPRALSNRWLERVRNSRARKADIRHGQLGVQELPSAGWSVQA